VNFRCSIESTISRSICASRCRATAGAGEQAAVGRRHEPGEQRAVPAAGVDRLTASAQDTDGTVARVEFFADASRLGSSRPRRIR
jgi:hypothetical protein